MLVGLLAGKMENLKGYFLEFGRSLGFKNNPAGRKNNNSSKNVIPTTMVKLAKKNYTII